MTEKGGVILVFIIGKYLILDIKLCKYIFIYLIKIDSFEIISFLII